MSDIDDLLGKLDGDFRFDTGQLLLNLLQYSIRNRKYLEVILKNQLEAKEEKGHLDQDFEETLDEIQKEIEQEYFDLLSFLSSRNK